MQRCPICKTEIPEISRYPRYVCKACLERAVAPDGRTVEFGNESFDGEGCAGFYRESGERYASNECLIDGIRCWAEPARFGGIVVQAGYPPAERAPRNPELPFTREGRPIEATLGDFWRWAFSDFGDNTMRGVLAEFIVAKALQCADEVRPGWLAYDLETPEGIRVEVKSSAYFQGWFQKRPSKILFSIRPARAWSPETNELDEAPRRHADVYVFSVLAHQDKETLDPLNLDQWEFYVLPAAVLDETGHDQKTIGLPTLERLGARKATYQTLRGTVDQSVAAVDRGVSITRGA